METKNNKNKQKEKHTTNNSQTFVWRCPTLGKCNDYHDKLKAPNKVICEKKRQKLTNKGNSGHNSKASKGLTSDHSAADRIKLTESNFSSSNGRVISQESRQRAAAAYWAESAPLFVCTLRFMNQLIVTVRRQHKADSTNEEEKKKSVEGPWPRSTVSSAALSGLFLLLNLLQFA